MNQNELEERILDFIHKETGWGDFLELYSEYEDLFFMEIKGQIDGSILVLFKYTFDEDGFSLNDKSHHLEGQLIFSKEREIVSSVLKETYTGQSSNMDPYKSKKEATD